MIAILAVLLHNGAIEAADLLCTPVDHQTESCTLTQAPTTRQAVQNYYQQMLRAQSYDRIPDLHHTPVPDLHYYVFGLRKIIV